MDTFLDRLKDEMNKLDEKIDKLDTFIMSDKFKELSQIQQVLLNVQVSAMETYWKCLAERLENIN